MLWRADEGEGQVKSLEDSTLVANQLGKRYRCTVCGTEVLCTKAGDGTVQCCGKDMEVQTPRPLPSSD